MIARNLQQVQARIYQAAIRAKRNPAEITLVGVSKHQPVSAMVEAYQAGLRHFGENRVEEMAQKIPQFLAITNAADPPILHMIGHLQSRKVAQALQYAQLIHSVDTVKLAERLNRLATAPLPILLECNISGEAGKAGFAVAGWQTNAQVLANFLQAVKQISQLSGVQLSGLMTMAPLVDDPQQTRSCFAGLRQLLVKCTDQFPDHPWPHLSMGMTNDFEVAIEEGATLVRVGRAIFGE